MSADRQRAAAARRSRRSRAAFTLLELTVVIGILGLLTSLIVPAVQAVREASRKTECRNRLHQFGVAMHHFESRERMLPPEGGPRLANSQGTGRPGWGPQSALVMLLRDMERPDLASLRELDATIPGWRAEVECDLWDCPSDPGRRPGTSYRVCTGAAPQKVRRTDPLRGSFSRPSTALRDVVDGLSSTIAFSERTRSDADPRRFDPEVEVLGTGLRALGDDDVDADAMLEACGAVGGAPAVGYSGQVGWNGCYANLIWTNYNHTAVPNSRVTDCTSEALESSDPGGANVAWTGMLTARSRHPGGVHGLFLDGAVRFVSDAIDLGVWRAAATIAGRESTGAGL